MNGGTIVALVGLGAAGFLYWRSQQQQAAALAAAQATPSPGLVQGLANTARQFGRATPTLGHALAHGATSGSGIGWLSGAAPARKIGGAVASVVHSIGGLL